jgi:hypothetical protein
MSWLIAACSLAVLAGCDQVDGAYDAVTGEGTVYECTTSTGRSVEVCYFDDAGDELADLVGGTCSRSTRSWPWFANLLHIGCAYSCPAPASSCNAHNGCYCP